MTTTDTTSAETTTGPTLEQVKAKQQQTWSSGDYGRIAWLTNPLADVLVEAVDLRPGARVLDVASGTGNVALAAARRFARVTSTDYVPALLDVGRARAAAEKPDDRVPGGRRRAPAVRRRHLRLHAVGHRRDVRPRPRAHRAELVRVTKPGGVVGTLNWTPTGFVGELLATVGRYAPPPAGVVPPPRWGTVEHQHELFDDAVTDLTFTEGAITQRFENPEHFADFFVEYYGPTLKAAASLDADGQAAFRADLAALGERFNRATDGTLVCDWQYLVAVARTR